MDAKSEEKRLPDGAEGPLSGPASSWHDVIGQLVQAMREQNAVVMALLEQNAEMLAMAADSRPVDDDVAVDMEGNPIRVAETAR